MQSVIPPVVSTWRGHGSQTMLQGKEGPFSTRHTWKRMFLNVSKHACTVHMCGCSPQTRKGWARTEQACQLWTANVYTMFVLASHWGEAVRGAYEESGVQRGWEFHSRGLGNRQGAKQERQRPSIPYALLLPPTAAQLGSFTAEWGLL